MPLSSIRRGDKAADADGPVLRFRNYTPKSEGLQGLQVPKPEMPNVEEQVGSAAIVHSDPTQEPLLNLAPKKVNWDLKRDMEPQMKKLRAMTDRAIIQIIRERVAAEGATDAAKTDLSTAVAQRQRGDDEDED